MFAHDSWRFLLPSHVPLCSICITFVFFLLTPYTTSLTFNLTHFQSELTRDGSYLSPLGLQLTPNERGMVMGDSAGRASYIRPLHLWDNASGELADFTTTFSFVINSDGSTNYGDGLTFFLARNNSVITQGNNLGLPISVSNTTSATVPFVAVEFDTYWNNGTDPYNSTYGGTADQNHVGIDINSIISVKFEKWWSNVSGGAVNEAWITYNATSQNLSVVFTGFRNNTAIRQYGLHHTVDLRTVLPEWVIFGFTASTGKSFQTNTIKSWSFNSSNLQVDESAEPPITHGEENMGGLRGNEENKTGLVVGLTVGSCVLFGGLAFVAFYLLKKRRRERKEEDPELDDFMDNEFEMGSGPKKLLYYELVRATNNFAEGEKLGEGGFGGVYRGFSKELGSYVAVKRVSRSSKQGLKEYVSEVKIIGQLRHRNLVQLIGWCHEKGELLLVYEFMENCSLDFHLFKEKSLLTWGVRFKIAQGLASALLYLHEEWKQCVVHRDIKSSNVMLDSSFNAKLGDFGLARLVDHEKGSQTTMVAGTHGYMAPEYINTGKASKESDVFSFGVVCLEIACGRKAIEFKAQESPIRLVEWVWDLYGTGKLVEAADPKLCTDFNEIEMIRLMIVGLWCAHPDSNHRPSIKQVIHVLNLEAPLPILPSKLPVATYFAPTSSFTSSYGESSEVDPSSYYNTDSSKLNTSSEFSSPSASLLYPK